jgi:hypothetical protein
MIIQEGLKSKGRQTYLIDVVKGEENLSEPISTSLAVFGALKMAWELKDKIQKRGKKPKLIIEKIYVANFIYQPDNPLSRFVIASVRNIGKSLAERCMGYLESEQTLQKEYKLHWADTPYTQFRNSAEPVDMPSNESRDLDIAFSLGGKGKNASQGFVTTSPIIVTGAPGLSTMGTYDPHLAKTRLITEEYSVGSWIAMPIALSYAPNVSQAYLEIGSYEVTVRVQPSKDGEGDKKRLRIISTRMWNALDVKVLP